MRRSYTVAIAPQRGEHVRYAVRREAAHERSRSKPRFSLARLRQTRGQHKVKNVVARDDGALRGQGAADAGTAFYVIVKKGGAVEGGAPSERELTPAHSAGRSTFGDDYDF